MLSLDLRPVNTLFSVGTSIGLSDRELLERFVGDSRAASESAFAALVARHGPMVMGVCRRALVDPHDVDDAFQATFLVLVCKARSVCVSDSLGRWLYGVSRRVARRARLAAARRPASLGAAADLWQARPSAETELAQALDEEIDRLPRRYREAVCLCYLEGLALREAAERIGCPIGTVGSRLSRARDLLKSRLGRRGLTTSAVAIASYLEAGQARGAVPAALFSNLTHVASPQSAGAFSAAAGVLATAILRGITMTKMGIAAGLLLAIGLGGAGAAKIIAPQDDGKPDRPAVRGNPGGQASIKPLSREERLRSILDEFRAAKELQVAALSKAATEKDQIETNKLLPDTVRFTDRLLALAEEQPADRAGRDAAIWIVEQSAYHTDLGSWGAKVSRAMEILLEYHADDVRVGRLCLLIDGRVSANRDRFLEALLARTKNREVRGLVTFSLGEYLAVAAESVQSLKTRDNISMKFLGGGGRLELDAPAAQALAGEGAAYFKVLMKKDSAVLRARAIDLLTEVEAKYAEIPDTRRAVCNSPPVDPAKPRTLADAARSALRVLRDLREGMLAPAIHGIDLNGKPVKLDAFRGKIVMIVFWASWCGPCMKEVPHERELVEKFAGRPFTILGINADSAREDALKAVKNEKMTWPQVFDGDPSAGAVARLYDVKSLPTFYIVDGDGVIRAKDDVLRGPKRDEVLEKLVQELEAKTARPK